MNTTLNTLSQGSPVSLSEDVDLMKILSGHIYFQTLYTAVEHDLFSLLYGKKLTKNEIMQALGINEKPCRILLLGLVTINLLHKENDLYANSKSADTYLCNQSPNNIKQIVRFEHFIVYKPMYHFYESTKKDTNIGLCEFAGDEDNLYERLSRTPELIKIFQDAMQEISKLANTEMTKQIDLAGVDYLLDIGGGNGSNIIALTERFKEMRASVFDFPAVCEVATQNLNTQSQKQRLSAIKGNVFVDDLPTGPDAIMFCHFFTIWSKEKNLLLLQKAYKALPAGGRVIIFNMMQNDAEDGPLTAAMGSPYFLTLATGEGMLYTWQEYKDLFLQAGFAKIDTQTLPNDHGLIIGYK